MQEPFLHAAERHVRPLFPCASRQVEMAGLLRYHHGDLLAFPGISPLRRPGAWFRVSFAFPGLVVSGRKQAAAGVRGRLERSRLHRAAGLRAEKWRAALRARRVGSAPRRFRQPVRRPMSRSITIRRPILSSAICCTARRMSSTISRRRSSWPQTQPADAPDAREGAVSDWKTTIKAMAVYGAR